MIQCQISRWSVFPAYITLLKKGLDSPEDDSKDMEARIESAVARLKTQVVEPTQADLAAEDRVHQEVAASLSGALNQLYEAKIDVKEAATIYFQTVMPDQLSSFMKSFRRDSVVAQASIDKIEQAVKKLAAQLAAEAKEHDKERQGDWNTVQRFLTVGGHVNSAITTDVQETLIFPVFIQLNRIEQKFTDSLVRRMKEGKTITVDLAFVNSARASYINQSSTAKDWLTVLAALVDVASIVRFCMLMS